MLLKEELSCADSLCSCIAMANATESLHCGYVLEGTPYTIFIDGWSGCMISSEAAPMLGYDAYCYQAGQNNVFGS